MTLDDAYERYNRGVELREAGNLPAALQLSLEVGDAGLALGYFELADHAHYERRLEEAQQWVDRMEALARSGDVIAHFACYWAYEFRRASCSAEEQEVKAKDHLQKAAELGNPVAQALLGGRYRSGTAGFRKDAGLYEYWMSKSIEKGEVDALCSYIEQRVMDGSVVSSALRSKVAAAAEQSERAAELLKRL